VGFNAGDDALLAVAIHSFTNTSVLKRHTPTHLQTTPDVMYISGVLKCKVCLPPPHKLTLVYPGQAPLQQPIPPHKYLDHPPSCKAELPGTPEVSLPLKTAQKMRMTLFNDHCVQVCA
jgi:hypothetical protein